ncbi:glycosyl transferase [Idiomarina piscisalsi]|uniref:Glycosyl transferase n=1 Tax=Idiomarina piscisalsi TaxID=1096243 RepID=A0ABM6LS50_9GAMM|nr:glycosyltransferase family protein [Idiomarina piscisalsi]ASG65373.1 glycosyl transferase [Idiomarina piscisalsi]
MRILYGIQGTGNGHLSRSHTLAGYLKQQPIDVDYLISGRRNTGLFDMDVFGAYQSFDGLSFVTENGALKRRKTISSNNWKQFYQDVKALDVTSYDVVITDYEPISAWAAKRAGVRCIGLGRQYAFLEPDLYKTLSLWQRQIIKQFAPCTTAVGMHWVECGNAIPPVVKESDDSFEGGLAQRIVVYLPFEDPEVIINALYPLDDYEFSVFHPKLTRCSYGHIECFAPSRQQFSDHFSRASAVISNAGFETSCEALREGKALIIKPLVGQFEQQKNAEILARKGLATVLTSVSCIAIEHALKSRQSTHIQWPNVAKHLANWITDGAKESVRDLSKRLWGI